MIILLDLNYTLVANSPPRGSTPPPMAKRLLTEAYRSWLIELIRPHTVILVTARPDRWKEATLNRLYTQTEWGPHEAHFAPPGWHYPPSIKRHFLTDHILPKIDSPTPMIAIESNPKTRRMYAAFQIPSISITGDNGPTSTV